MLGAVQPWCCTEMGWLIFFFFPFSFFHCTSLFASITPNSIGQYDFRQQGENTTRYNLQLFWRLSINRGLHISNGFWLSSGRSLDPGLSLHAVYEDLPSALPSLNPTFSSISMPSWRAVDCPTWGRVSARGFHRCVWDRQPCTLAVGRNTKWHSHQLILIPSGFQRANSAKDKHSVVLAGFAVDWKEIGKEFCSICMLLSSLLLDKVTQIFQFSLDVGWWLFKAQWWLCFTRTNDERKC